MSKSKDSIPKDYVSAEAAIRPKHTGLGVLSSYERDDRILTENLKDYIPAMDDFRLSAKRLRELGFNILEFGTVSISIGGNVDLFEKRCNVQLKARTPSIFTPSIMERLQTSTDEFSFFGTPEDQPILHPPDSVKNTVEGIVIPEMPTFFSPVKRTVSARPPHTLITYHQLHPVDDVPMLLQASQLHARGYLGKGVRIAMIDSGFYYDHPYYKTRGYNMWTIGEPIPGMNSNTDTSGHGTPLASNLLAIAPAVNLVSIKMARNPILAFKLALRQRPKIISNSWGWPIDTPPTPVLNASNRILEIEIINAVTNGITILFAAGNEGEKAWPSSIPEVISVGGAYYNENLELEASNYASSFDSVIYEGRHVPDICGLCGQAPFGIYISMPTQPKSWADFFLGEGKFPNGDQTGRDDGWLCASGTSAATPMIAGVIALLLEKDPDLQPDEIKSILERTTQDVTKGQSATGDKAGDGWDPATGYGLVDAYKAWNSV